jgi:hypothetical protein
MDEMLKKAQAGESVVGRKKVWSLALADDLVIVAKSEKEIMKNLGKFVRKKKLEVNVEKKKKRKRKSEENEWNWEGRKIEKINNFKYLYYTFNQRLADKAHIK